MMKTNGLSRTSSWVVVGCFLVGTSVASAAPIVAGPTSYLARAIQDVTLFGGTAINPGPTIEIPDFSGVSIIGINREAQVGNMISFNSAIGGSFAGSLPGFGSYVFGAVGPYGPADYSGQFTNVQQDANDPGFATGDPSSFVSGDFFFEGAGFGLEFTSGPLAGVVLETDPTQSFAFQSVWDGLPPSPGNVWTNSGTDVLNVLFNGEVVGTSSNRRIVALPEPHAGQPQVMVVVVGALLGMVRGRRKS